MLIVLHTFQIQCCCAHIPIPLLCTAHSFQFQSSVLHTHSSSVGLKCTYCCKNASVCRSVLDSVRALLQTLPSSTLVYTFHLCHLHILYRYNVQWACSMLLVYTHFCISAIHPLSVFYTHAVPVSILGPRQVSLSLCCTTPCQYTLIQTGFTVTVLYHRYSMSVYFDPQRFHCHCADTTNDPCQ